MDEGSQKAGSRLSLPLANSSSADPKRVSLPITTVTPVKRCESPQSKRVVLKELCANTFKKLSINNKVTPSPLKSGSSTPSSKQPPASPEKDHETNVQFAREFVEELVEKLPGDSVPVLPEKEDTTRYSVAFSDISAFSETSLPDLLQPEAQYKKQADTDTDTTDYESAVESDALSVNTSLGLDRSDPVSSPDVLDPAVSPSPDSTPRVHQPDTDTFEDAEASFDEGRLTPHLDISTLCLDVGRLSLDSPQRPSICSSKGDSFLITFNPGCEGVSADTSYNTESPGFVLGESFIEKSHCESNQDSEILSTTFEVAPASDISTEYKLEIIRTLEFDLEKPVESEAEVGGNLPVDEAVSCDGNKLLPEVEPVNPVVELEAADVETVSGGDSQAEPVEDAAKTCNDSHSEIETEPLNSSTVVSGLEAVSKDLQDIQLIASEVDSTPINNKTFTQEESSSAPLVEESAKDNLPASEPDLSFKEEKSSVVDLEVQSVPIVEETTTEVSPAPEPEFSLQEEKSSNTDLEVPAVLIVEESTTEVSPAPEPELSLPEEKSSNTDLEVPSVPIVEESETEVSPAPEPELDRSTVTEPEAVSSELTPPVEETKVLSTLNSDPSLGVVGLPESAESTVESKSLPSSEASDKAESLLIVEKSTPIVEPQISTVAQPVGTQPALQASVISEHEFTGAPLTVEPQVESQLIVGFAESEPSVNLTPTDDKGHKKEDLPTVGIQEKEIYEQPTIVPEKVDDLLKAASDTLIVETTENNPITVSSVIANKEPAKFGDLQVTEPKASASVGLGLESERAVSPCQFPAEEEELLAISSAPVNFSAGNPTEQFGRKCTISPSFLLIDNNTPNRRASPVPADSVLTPTPTYQQPFADSNKQAEVIDPVGAIWSADVDKSSCFSAPPLQAKPVPRKKKQEPIVNPIQFRGSPLYPEVISKNESIPFVSASQLDSLAPSGDPFSPIPVKTEPGTSHFITKSLKSANALEDQSLNDLREICQRQQRELDNQQFSSNLFGDSLYNSLAIANIAAEAAKVSEDIQNASIEQIEFEMDENVNPVPLDKKWLSERSGAGAKADAKETAKSRNILGGGDGFGDSLDKQNKNIMTASIDAQTNQSEAGPEIALQDEEETFQDSEGFDFLSAKASTGPSDRLVRESLYTKFDPLATPLAAPVAAPVAAPAARNAPLPMPPKFSENDNKTSPPAGQLIQLAPTPVAVTPPRSSTPNQVLMKTTPPTNSPARALIDKLISLSPAGRNIQASPVKPPPPVVKTPTPATMEQMSEELVLLRELLSEEDLAHKVSLASLEEKLRNTEQELQAMRQKAKAAEEREQKIMARLGEKVTAQKQLAAVMCEYEKTISKLVGEKENERAAFIKEKDSLVKEKDVALGHLTNIESAFSDLHQKYERCKTVVEAFKSNEDVLRESLAKYEATIHKHEQKYDMLKAHAMTQLENANQELDAVRRNQATENAKLKAMLKKSELKTSSLEEMLEQKVKENCELASICDDLIAKVGT